jgi:hypothetical protein
MVKRRLQNIVAAALGAMFCIGCGSARDKLADAASTGESAEAKGERIVAEYLKRDAAPFRKMRVRFTIDAEGDPQKVYEVDSWRKQTPEGTTTLSQIVRPAEDADLGSLTLEPKGQKPTVITYIASRDEFRETDTSKMFFGGLTGAELLGEWDKYTFRAVGEKDLAGQKVVEVEGKLKQGETTIFARLNALFRTDNFMPVELRSFDNNDREIRTWRIVDIKGEPMRPFAARTEVDNPVFKAKIVIEILSREFPNTIDDAVFTRERLKQIARK